MDQIVYHDYFSNHLILNHDIAGLWELYGSSTVHYRSVYMNKNLVMPR
jgi:hypothetical protein